MSLEYVDPLDTGERYVLEFLSGTLWAPSQFRWAIVDRNTGELMRKMADHQPHAKGKFIWRGERSETEWWCAQLNASTGRHVDAGTGPEMQGRRVDIGVVIGQRLRRKEPVAGPPVFVRCEACRRCHRPGSCPVS